MEIRGDLDVRRYLYLTCQSDTEDTVGDIRMYSTPNTPVHEKCTEASAVKGGGTWEVIEYVNVLDSEELPTEELPTEEFPSTEIIFTSEEVEGVGEQIIITETVNPDNVTYNFSLDESKIDHNNLFNWEADRHREMNYDEDIKTYLIND